MPKPVYVPDLDAKDDATKPPVKLMADFLKSVRATQVIVTVSFLKNL
jgi:hypothetical protein